MDPRRALRHLPVPLPGVGGPRTILELDLGRGLLTAPPATPMAAWQARHAASMRAVREGLRQARRSREVAGLLVHVGDCPLSLPAADEVAELLAGFGADRPVIAWTETFGEMASGLAGYRVASAASQVWMQPSGMLGLTGVQLDILLLRGGLAKLGLDPEFGQRHEFKTAADQLSATEVSGANRAMMQRLADALVEDTVARVADRRRLAAAEVEAAMTRAPLSARKALSAGLIDRIGYRDEVYAHARSEWGTEHLRYVHRWHKDTGHLARAVRAVDQRRPAIAVVDIRGPIVTGHGRSGQAGSDAVAARLRAAQRDDQVAGVLLRVDSPGGSYVASDAIHREVGRLRESGRPVVASMGDVAASGGYFVSMAADEIVCRPSTLTGSIGVLAGKFVAERLVERIGVVRESVSAGPRAAMMSSGRSFDAEEWAVLDAWLDEVYADFTAKAAAGRGMELDELEPLARGRVWVGVDAHERGLVDHLGGTDLAIDRVCDLARVDRDRAELRTGPPFPFLAGLKPAESSESGHAAAAVEDLTGVDALLARWADRAGLALPHGALSLPGGPDCADERGGRGPHGRTGFDDELPNGPRLERRGRSVVRLSSGPQTCPPR